MKLRGPDRIPAAGLLAIVVTMAQVAALLSLGHQWVRSFPTPRDIYWGAFVPFQGEHYFPCETPDRLWAVIDAIELKSGRIRQTDLPFLTPWHGMVASDNRLWVVTGSAVIETDGIRQRRFNTQRALKSPICSAFLFQGCPAIVDLDDSGVKYRLFVFEAGEWHDRGEVGIPGNGRVWVRNHATGRMQLQPCANSVRPGPKVLFNLRVLTIGGVNHVFYFDYESGIVAYREGLDVVPVDSNMASALAPENAAADTTGWIKMDFKPEFFNITFHQGQLFMLEIRDPKLPMRLWQKQPIPAQSPFTVALELPAGNRDRIGLIESPVNGELYLVRDNRLHQTVSRDQDGEFQEIPCPWESDLARLVRWAASMAGQLAVVLATGLLILVLGAESICRDQDVSYDVGDRIARLAPIWRRCVARAIDLAILLTLPLILVAHIGPDRIAAFVWDSTWNANSMSLEALNHEVLWPSVTWVIVVFITLVATQARWGLTPGKWLCGIRARRSTLRPCGLARSLVRELLFVADVPGLIMILPGMMSLLMTDRRQRLGDRVADTVVIEVSRGS